MAVLAGGRSGPDARAKHHFLQYAPEKIPYAIERYVKEAERLYSVLDKRLAGREFMAGAYSIADIATYPWIAPHARRGLKLDDFPNVRRWLEAIGARPAVMRAYEIAKGVSTAPVVTDESRSVLFGQGRQLPR